MVVANLRHTVWYCLYAWDSLVRAYHSCQCSWQLLPSLIDDGSWRVGRIWRDFGLQRQENEVLREMRWDMIVALRKGYDVFFFTRDILDKKRVKKWGWRVTNATTLPLAPKLGFIPVTILSLSLTSFLLSRALRECLFLPRSFFCSSFIDSMLSLIASVIREKERERERSAWGRMSESNDLHYWHRRSFLASLLLSVAPDFEREGEIGTSSGLCLDGQRWCRFQDWCVSWWRRDCFRRLLQ